MPKQTFFNLPDEKRENILGVAMTEFAEHGYRDASVSRIVESCGIAKGSFYQYFADKADLYEYIVVSCVAERKLQVYRDNEDMLKSLNLSGFLRYVFKAQVEEFMHNPNLIRVAVDFIRNADEPVCRKILSRYSHLTENYFIGYIRHEKDEGELDPEVDETLLNFMLVSLGNYFMHWMSTNNMSYNSLTQAHIDMIVDKLDYILTNGIYGANKAE
jgi:AcrR family transcriptional regulator